MTELPKSDHDLIEEYDGGDEPRYAPRESIEPMALCSSLLRLQLMRNDLFMPQQAHNLDMVDQFLLDLECQVLRDYFQTDRTPPETHFLSAQSQMWIFAAYELLRTWFQRARNIVKWSNNGGLNQKLDALKAANYDYVHHGYEMQISQLEEIIAHPEMVGILNRHIRHLQIPFGRLEFIRVAIAKHEVSGREKSIAFHPGYGRINMYCGSLDYELENGKYIMGTISRRDIADSLRFLDLDSEPPSEAELKSFGGYMSGNEETGGDMS